MVEPRELVAKAADYIEEHGHAKGILEDGMGRVCVGGALILAGGGSIGSERVQTPNGWNEAMDLVADHLGVTTGSYWVVQWNNHPERTQDEVVAALRAVAAQPVGDAHEYELVR